MATDQYKLATDNDPNIIVTLISQGHRTGTVWAHPYNESFYLPPLCQATSKIPREIQVYPKDPFREVTPDDEDPTFIKPSEPSLQITFSRKPKNPGLGYLLGSEPELCDIFLGSLDDSISQQMFTISLNKHNEVILTSLSRKQTSVTYGNQEAKRRNFTWIFPPKQRSISVQASQSIKFIVEIPTHETDKPAYEANCRTFKNCRSEPDNGLASRGGSTDQPFFLRTHKIGDGGFGVVFKARSMPDGRSVAIKEFKTKAAWTLEADVLKRLSSTPHENIVEFLGYGLGNSPYLAMGLASGGNLAEQHNRTPFTVRETAIILRQMLDAFVYLHVTFKMIHRDIKPQNILCESRAHFRLADFGLAKEGLILMTFKGTRHFMAPEMFEDRPYTAAVDLWALGMVIAWLMYGNNPQGHTRDEGPIWCEAVISNFQEHEKSSRAIMTSSNEQTELNLLVGQCMLKMKPEQRQSARGCQEKGYRLWHLLDHVSCGDSNATTQKDPKNLPPNETSANNSDPDSKQSGLVNKYEASLEHGALAEERENDSQFSDEPPSDEEGDLNAESGPGKGQPHNDSEAETEFPGEGPPNSDEWEDLEREFPRNEAKSGRSPRHFVYGNSVKETGNEPEHSTAPSS